MGKQQVSVDGIQKEQKHKLNPDKDLVVMEFSYNTRLIMTHHRSTLPEKSTSKMAKKEKLDFLNLKNRKRT
ncbi:unnamed protein product [Prunus armeniaca]|uniref:Uncharacterized protein n=1 Tax=Prunus armeniaca TaxID=36596 RepID=A0A6J5VG38_PRUAR|nr:unnamed protein product [Prunus armeniaca]